MTSRSAVDRLRQTYFHNRRAVGWVLITLAQHSANFPEIHKNYSACRRALGEQKWEELQCQLDSIFDPTDSIRKIPESHSTLLILEKYLNRASTATWVELARDLTSTGRWKDLVRDLQAEGKTQREKLREAVVTAWDTEYAAIDDLYRHKAAFIARLDGPDFDDVLLGFPPGMSVNYALVFGPDPPHASEPEFKVSPVSVASGDIFEPDSDMIARARQLHIWQRDALSKLFRESLQDAESSRRCRSAGYAWLMNRAAGYCIATRASTDQKPWRDIEASVLELAPREDWNNYTECVELYMDQDPSTDRPEGIIDAPTLQMIHQYERQPSRWMMILGKLEGERDARWVVWEDLSKQVAGINAELQDALAATEAAKQRRDRLLLTGSEHTPDSESVPDTAPTKAGQQGTGFEWINKMKTHKTPGMHKESSPAKAKEKDVDLVAGNFAYKSKMK